MLAMFIPWIVVLLARATYADFHFLSCASSGPSSSALPSALAIAVPTSDMTGCNGILGERMIIIQNLTQPVGQASVFSMENFCEANRLDVRLASSDLLGIFFSGGDGTLLGECSPSPPKKFNCSSPSLSLDCTDSWTCFSGICEAPREGSLTTQSPVPSSVTSSAGGSQTPVSPTNTSVPDIQTSPSSVGSPSPKVENDRSSQKTSIVVGAVLGVVSLCLALAMALLIWRRRRTGEKIREADNPPIGRFTEVPPVFETIRPFPVVATRTSHSSTFSPKTAGPISAAPWAGSSASAPWAVSTSPTVHEELRQAVREAVREAIPSRSRSSDSWHTNTLPPSYSRGEAEG